METAVLEPIKPKYPGFTAESAALMRERKRLKLESLKAQAAAQKQAAQLAKLNPQLIQPVTELDEYTSRRLLRVRKQLDMIDDEIDSAIKNEPASVKPLVEAQSRLSEQERFLANRPGPGTRKPKAEPTRKANQSCDPVDE